MMLGRHRLLMLALVFAPSAAMAHDAASSTEVAEAAPAVYQWIVLLVLTCLWIMSMFAEKNGF